VATSSEPAELELYRDAFWKQVEHTNFVREKLLRIIAKLSSPAPPSATPCCNAQTVEEVAKRAAGRIAKLLPHNIGSMAAFNTEKEISAIILEELKG
jgi:hypothetical protein